MKIHYLGQSGYLIKTAEITIAVDPYLSDSVVGCPRLLPVPIEPENFQVDYVICTHDHQDHLDPEMAIKMPKNTHFLTTQDGNDHLKKLGITKCKAVRPGDAVSLGDLRVTFVPAVHTVPAVGIVISGEGKTLYFSGDTYYDEKLLEIARFKPDIAFICINGKWGNMNVTEAADFAKKLGSKMNIPTHYDMFATNSEDPAKFTALVLDSKILEFNKIYDTEKLL